MEEAAEKLNAKVAELRRIIADQDIRAEHEQQFTEHEKAEVEAVADKLKVIIGLRDTEITRLKQLLPSEMIPVIAEKTHQLGLHWKPRSDDR